MRESVHSKIAGGKAYKGIIKPLATKVGLSKQYIWKQPPKSTGRKEESLRKVADIVKFMERPDNSYEMSGTRLKKRGNQAYPG